MGAKLVGFLFFQSGSLLFIFSDSSNKSPQRKQRRVARIYLENLVVDAAVMTLAYSTFLMISAIRASSKGPSYKSLNGLSYARTHLRTSMKVVQGCAFSKEELNNMLFFIFSSACTAVPSESIV